MRKPNLLVIVLLAIPFVLPAQQPKSTSQKKPDATVHHTVKKYPSLLWEITGKGLKKPSYLFGTMHISDKLVFHLGDSFYNAIKSVDVVALETNPDNWQDDYSESVFLKNRNRSGFGNVFFEGVGSVNDKMLITSFAIDNYDEAIKASLAVEPAMVNGLLYRTYGNRMADFEEDTYLDMHIFQTGKKLGKKMAGVENFKESEKLVIEAYRDMYKDEKRKRKSFDYEGMFANPKKLEEAYRKGDLDVVDSLDALEVTSDAFQEKFLYKRNEIQAKNSDSIMKKNSLFVAVGAAHLPGKRGIIEMLRNMGYTLRPVKMDARNSKQKESIDNIRSAAAFVNQTSGDSFYQVQIPGKKFYGFTEWGGMDVKQFADMGNGSYYMVTRVKTNSHFQGLNAVTVFKKIDSLLYENIPGKILKKIPISKNGYKGWEILNRTRRGDHQRYNVFVTPFEIIVFKMSGNGEYIKAGDEAKRFFSSIKLKEYKEISWSNFQPAFGGFSVQLPHAPCLLRDENTGTDRLEYAALDQSSGNSYLVMKSNFYNFDFAEEDSFELNLMDESYAFSSFIDKQLNRNLTTLNGYPALETKYLHKDGSFSTVKFIIRGPIYYMAAVRHKNENEGARKFIESFSIKPFIYPEIKLRTDTAMKFSVQSPFFPDEKKKDELETMIESLRMFSYSDDEDEEDFTTSLNDFNFKMIGNDTLGEKILITSRKPGKYTYIKDTAAFWKNNFSSDDDRDSEEYDDSTFIYKLDKRYELPGGIKCRELQMTDTGSSRLIRSKFIFKDGHVFSLRTITDTLNANSPFLSKFFSSFAPFDTLKGESLFTRKTEQFFKDYFSTDSVIAKKGRKSLSQIEFDSADAPLVKKAIEKVNWKTRDYLEVKKNFITELGGLKDSTITPFLKQLYPKVKDTSDFQNAILNALLSQKTKESFIAFKDLILQEPPVETGDNSYYRGFHYPVIRFNSFSRIYASDETSYDGPWSELHDTLALTKSIFPDFLQLINVDDYKDEVLDLVIAMVDSGYLKASGYEPYFGKFYLDAKQLLKKQIAREDNDNIEKESRKDRKKNFYDDEDDEKEMDDGNTKLEEYAVLMLPFYDKNPGVQSFFEQLKQTKDRQLLYNINLLMLRNNKPVPDSFFTQYSKLDEYRSKLYEDLKDIKKLDKFPSENKKQVDIARSLILTNSGIYDKPDSLTYIDRLPVSYENKKGWVYFFKFKEERDDNYWQFATAGMQPEKEDSIDIENDDFTNAEGRKIAADKPIKEQMEKMLKEMLYSKRESASDFYDARRYNIYKNYLSEIVKRNRFGE